MIEVERISKRFGPVTAVDAAVLLPLEWAIGGKVRNVLSDDLDDLKASIEKITGS